jgi:hypothetical protein
MSLRVIKPWYHRRYFPSLFTLVGRPHDIPGI